jgi:hypothetical protein
MGKELCTSVEIPPGLTEAVFGLKESSLVDVKMGTDTELAKNMLLTQGPL